LLTLRRHLAVLVLCASAAAVAAPKTDVIALRNGDRITGEVKEMERGKLRFKTDNAGTIYIEWDKVTSLVSGQRLRAELSNGERYMGTALTLSEPGQLQLSDAQAGTTVRLPMQDIVELYPVEQGLRLATIDGYLTAGYSYTKANNLQEFNFTGGVNTTQEKRKWSLDASTAMTSQDGANDTQRYDVIGQVRHFLPQRWFLQETLQFESNDELALNLRTSLGAAYGRYLAQTRDHEWSVYAGANLTYEREVAATSKRNVEAVIGTQYAFFRYDTPERNVLADLAVLPSLTESGRVRTGAELRFRWEIIKDFFFELSAYGIYDNKPGPQATSQSDYGTVTSLGFTF
jgi:Holliday junction resolvase